MKIRFSLLIIITLILLCCQNKRVNDSKVVQSKVQNSPASRKTQTNTNRKLRYLYFANGGLIGYFDDSTISGCARCMLVKENIELLKNREVINTYTIGKDGSLVTKDGAIEHPYFKKGKSEGWPLIDYKWEMNL